MQSTIPTTIITGCPTLYSSVLDSAFAPRGPLSAAISSLKADADAVAVFFLFFLSSLPLSPIRLTQSNSCIAVKRTRHDAADDDDLGERGKVIIREWSGVAGGRG